METGTGPDQRIGPNDPAKAIRETERAVQPTVRPVILPTPVTPMEVPCEAPWPVSPSIPAGS